MRNPGLHLVGIAASPGGGGVFGTKAEEELRQWLDTRLDELGIDPVAYSRFVLSLLRHPDSALTPPGDVVGPVGTGRGRGRRVRTRPRSRLPLQGDREQRRAVVQCLTSAADQKCGIESLVDELCAKLRDLEGGASKNETEDQKDEGEAKPSLETLTPQDRALRYYAAFPALQPATPKKFPHRKDKNLAPNNIIINNNNNNNSNNNRNGGIGNSNKNNKNRQKKTKMSITIESQQGVEKEGFGFAKSMEREREREREKEQELEMDRLRLAQLKAKFDENLEALWDTGSGNSQGTDSIWAAPSLSIPSKPLWPNDANETVPFIASTSKSEEQVVDTSFQKSVVDDSHLIPWNLDLVGTKDCSDEIGNKNNTQYNVTWSETLDGSWCWTSMDKDSTTADQSSATGEVFPVVPCQSTDTVTKEARFAQKVNNLQEPEEDLLTSARTHFRPIRDDGNWADGTTFAVTNTFERVAYRRSESGNLFYLPGGETPYMEYREKNVAPASSSAVSTNLTLKFRVRQCDKCIQTEPILSPIKRRILSEQDRFYYSSTEAEEAATQEIDEETEKDGFILEQQGWAQPTLLLHNERKRRHSSSFSYRPLTALRPLTL